MALLEDPWKHPAFAVAGIAAFVTADITGPILTGLAGIEQAWIGEYIAAGLAGILFGFIIDDMVPAYIAQKKGGASGVGGGGDDFGGGGDDFDFE